MNSFSIDKWCELLGSMVSIDSVSSPGTDTDRCNLEMLEFLSESLKRLDFDCQIQKVDTNSQLEKYNLYARVGPETADGLVLGGHSDTVPANPELWSADPWKLQRQPDRVIGLGCADMKGFFASIITAMDRIDRNRLRKPVAVIATANEESDMIGARQLDASFLDDFSYVIIGEPTALVPVNAHKGILMERIRLRGNEGHSSRPQPEHHAIEGMHAVIAGLLSWQKELKQHYADDGKYANFDISWPTINLGRIAGGDIANRIAPECLLDIDCRFFADSSSQTIRSQLRQRVRQAIEAFELDVEFEELFSGAEATHTPANSPLIRHLEHHCKQPTRGVSFATEAPYFNKIIEQVAVLGPGRIETAHQADEYLEIDKVTRFDSIVLGIIDDLCLS